jgi:hypothetical protein
MKRAVLLSVVALAAGAALFLAYAVGRRQAERAMLQSQAAGLRADLVIAEGVKAGGDQFRIARTAARASGLSDGMILRIAMMMDMAVSADDPAAILALKNVVELTDDQAGRLQAVVARARQDANAVLTDEQKLKLAAAAEGPSTMLQMQPTLRKAMSQMMARPGVRMMQRAAPGASQ